MPVAAKNPEAECMFNYLNQIGENLRDVRSFLEESRIAIEGPIEKCSDPENVNVQGLFKNASYLVGLANECRILANTIRILL